MDDPFSHWDSSGRDLCCDDETLPARSKLAPLSQFRGNIYRQPLVAHTSGRQASHLNQEWRNAQAGQLDLIPTKHRSPSRLRPDTGPALPRSAIINRVLGQALQHIVLETWLNAVEATLTDALTQSHQESAPSRLVPQAQQENMLGEAITYRALLQSFQEETEATLPLCQRAQALLSADNFGARTHIAVTRL